MDSIRDVEKRATLGQRGFTLIEIIAVLVIMGILAAVAVPQFVNLQDEARNKALEGAFAAGASQLAMDYAESLLKNEAWADKTGVTLGDFTADLTAGCGEGVATVTLTAGPDWFDDVTGDKEKTFTICPE